MKHFCCFFSATLLLSSAVFGWNAGTLSVDVVNSPMDIKISADGKTLAEITSISFGSSTYTTVTSVTETPDSITINLSGSTSLSITKVQSGIRLYGKVATAQSVKIGMKDQGDHFFGISEQNLFATNNPDLRERTVTCAVMSYDTKENYAQAWSPFYFSSLGYAGYFDTFAEGTYVFGVSGTTSITHTTNTIDWYVFYGPTGDKIHQAYFKIIGAPKKVPMWACGPVIWNDNFTGSSQVLNYASNSASNMIPITSIMIDRPYSDGNNQWSEMNFNANFANPGTWNQQTLNTENNIKLVTWVAPCTFGPVNPPGQWNSTFYYLDLSKQESASWFKDRLSSRQHTYGVQGHKMDRAEDQFPVDSAWYDGTPRQERRAKYLMLYAKVIDEVLRSSWGDDQFNVARAAYSRSQQYLSAVWGGDPKGPWVGLSGNLANCIRTGFIGFPMWGSDCGSYFDKSKIPSDQLLRWGAFGVFSGFMESMLDGKEPWIYTSDVIAKVKSQYDLRMQLLPYIYSLANNSADIGVMQRPLAYMYPNDPATWTNWDEYLFGPAMLVAPMYSTTTSRGVYLPAGTWINFWDYNDVQNGNTTITASVPAFEQIPVYIKRNSIFPTGQIYSGNMIKWISNFNATRNVVINAFPGAAGDSSDFTYVDYLDTNSRKTLSVRSLAGNIIQVQSPAMTVSGKVMVRLDTLPTSVKLNGVVVTNWQYSSTTKKLEVPFQAKQAIALEVALDGNGSSAIALPGRVQAEDYQSGGEGVGYHDLTNGNSGAAYRNDNVDIQNASDVGGGYSVGWISAGEWLAFNVNVSTTGIYNLTARMASATSGTKTMTVTLDGTAIGTFSTTDASGWQSWKNVVVNGLNLSAGPHSLRMNMTTGGFNINYLDVNAQTSQPGTIQFSSSNYSVNENSGTVNLTVNRINGSDGSVTVNYATTNGTAIAPGDYTTKSGTLTFANGITSQTISVSITDDVASESNESFSVSLSGATGGATIGSPSNASVTITDNDNSLISLPGRVQAENYKTGGEGVGYHDLTSGNSGGAYRTDSVDIENTSDTGNGYNVGWISGGEWLAFDVNVTTTGLYDLTTRMASANSGTKTMTLTLDGATIGTFSTTDASGWQSWKNVVVNGVNLTAGTHELRMNMTTGGFNLNYIDITVHTPETPVTITYEAENLTRTASSIGSNVSTGDAQNSNSAYVQLSGTPAVGAWLEFTLPNLVAATYNIKMYFKSNSNRGICQGSVDGANLGSTCDEYRTNMLYQVMFNMGDKALTSGNHNIRFTVTGKNTASAGYTMTIDKIVLTRQ